MTRHLRLTQRRVPHSARKIVGMAFRAANFAGWVGIGRAQDDAALDQGYGSAVAVVPAVTDEPVFAGGILAGHDGVAAPHGDGFGQRFPVLARHGLALWALGLCRLARYGLVLQALVLHWFA